LTLRSDMMIGTRVYRRPRGPVPALLPLAAGNVSALVAHGAVPAAAHMARGATTKPTGCGGRQLSRQSSHTPVRPRRTRVPWRASRNGQSGTPAERDEGARGASRRGIWRL